MPGALWSRSHTPPTDLALPGESTEILYAEIPGANFVALAAGHSMDEAVQVAARCGAAVLTGRGAYAGQLGGGDFTL